VVPPETFTPERMPYHSTRTTMRALNLLALASTVVLGACGDQVSDPAPTLVALPNRATLSVGAQRARDSLPPHPYSASIDGPPHPNSTPQLNVAGLMRQDIGLPRRGLHKTSGLSPTAPSTSIGIAPTTLTGPNKTFEIPEGWSDALVYAPTTIPHGGSCIEVSMIHWVGSRHGAPDHAMGIWDWCNHPAGPFQVMEDVTNPTWQARYMSGHVLYPTTGSGTEEFTAVVAIVADQPTAADSSSDCWTAMLWNKQVGQWEQKYRSCGVTQINQVRGWTMHESYHMQGYYSPTCPTISSLSADGLFSLRGSSASLLTPPSVGDGSTSTLLTDGPCWLGGQYGFYESPYNGFYGWRALTPTSAF
jgi:hypothetical protein